MKYELSSARNQMTVLSRFFQMFIVLGMYIFVFRAKMHTGKSSIYLPCLSYETAKVHVISVKGQVLLQSLVNTKDIKLPYFLCFNFLDFFEGLNDTGEVNYISDRNSYRNSWRIPLPSAVFEQEFLKNFDDKCRFSVRNSGRILMTYHMLTNLK